MRFGLDLLGIAKYEDAVVKAIPKGFAIGCFSSTFGDARLNILKLINSLKTDEVRIQLLWKHNHFFSSKDFPDIRSECALWRRIVSEHHEVNFQVSPACEAIWSSRKEAVTACQIVKEELPTCTPVNVSNYTISTMHALGEVHGSKVKPPRNPPYNFSFDGSSATEANVEAIKDTHKQASTFYLWNSRFNGRWEDNDDTPIAQRQGYPTVRFIKSIAALARRCGLVNLPHGWIYKSHAENKGTGDKRAEKPLFIAPKKYNSILLKKGTRVVEVFKYYGAYLGGGYRYYSGSGKYGYEMAEEPLEVFADGKRYGMINPAFRWGKFR